MAWFYIEKLSGDVHTIIGDDARHIEKSLRMTQGETLTLCDCDGMEHHCEIIEIQKGSVTVRILESKTCDNEPKIKLTLFQALPKGDKMDLIIQKAVELGVTEIVPIISARCVSRPDSKTLLKKTERWQKIALAAAMQSRRGIVPKVCSVMSFEKAIEAADKSDLKIVFYECGGENLETIIKSEHKNISIFIGSEGGFEEGEIEKIKKAGGSVATLGRRILRAETAPLAAISIIMYETGNFNL
ncbi:MAG: 16S rRNA (uracil(1498)-N(3))-methyltransferase [Bacillota bacterium]|nr:16S rRNA (uracil(1498)-N(3))-methyltransferase [Bacillota bacterium]